MTGMPARLVEFVGSLREHGIAVGPGETIDAAAAAEVVGLADREQLRAALAAAVLRRGGQRATFDAVFDLYFPAAVGAAENAAEPTDLESLQDDLVAAIGAGNSEGMRALAATGVGEFGEIESPGGMSGWSAYQTLKQLQADALLDRVLAAIREEQLDGLDAAVARKQAQSRIAEFREYVRTEARRRTAELRGSERISRHAIAPQTDLVSFTSASREQIAELRRTIQPLSRKLATRLAVRRRRARRGQIDLRRTLRRSLATGGVPMRPVLRARRPGRPELVLLCDVSGSVAGFAQFTLLLVQALADQFSKVRSFAFVGLTDEITGLVTTGAADPEGLARRIMTEARLATWRSTDYGNSLRTFMEQWPDAVSQRTSVLILGDGRTNGGDPNLDALRRIAERARHVYWLNPEPPSSWGTGDSAAPQYAGVVPMYECRNLRQLTQLVTELIPG